MSSFGARVSAVVVGLALVVAGATAAVAGPSPAPPGASPAGQPPLSQSSADKAAAALAQGAKAAPPGVLAVPQAVTGAVASNGALCAGQGFGVVSATRISTGTYEVFFNQTITSGVYVASIGLCGNLGASAPGEITVVGRFGTTNGLFIQTYDSTGLLADRGFHVSAQF